MNEYQNATEGLIIIIYKRKGFTTILLDTTYNIIQ